MSRIVRKYLGVTSLLFASLLGSGVLATEALADTTYDVGVLGTTEYTNSVFYSGNNVSFTDTYNFAVSPTAKVGLGATNLLINGLFNITGLTLNLYDSGNNLIGSGLSFSGTLTTGLYHATVSGITSGPFGGGYTFYAGAVPEAETWGMIAVGIGMIGFQIRRRKNKQSIPSKLA